MVAAAFPDESVTSPQRSSRLGALLRHPQRSAVLLAVLIGFASILSAAVAWRASLESNDASRYQSLAVQQQARREQIEDELQATVEEDQRFVAEYEEDALAARQLQSQADSTRTTDPASADQLDLGAQSRLAMARTLEPFFTAQGVSLDADGTVHYDAAYVLRVLSDGDPELRELETSKVGDLQSRANNRSIDLIGVGALIVAALFFLTIAQVSRTRVRLRQVFFVAGGLMVGVGAVGFLLVELLA